MIYSIVNLLMVLKSGYKMCYLKLFWKKAHPVTKIPEDKPRHDA
jgi:hypothetical protein